MIKLFDRFCALRARLHANTKKPRANNKKRAVAAVCAAVAILCAAAPACAIEIPAQEWQQIMGQYIDPGQYDDPQAAPQGDLWYEPGQNLDETNKYAVDGAYIGDTGIAMQYDFTQPARTDDGAAGDDEAPMVDFPEGVERLGSDADIALDKAAMSRIISALPDTRGPRLGVVLCAYSLADKVDYFWGGKSRAIGWDARWGNRTYVTASGSPSTGTLRAFGLDCSGYVAWVFNNAVGASVSGAAFGNSSARQWENSTPIEWNDAQAGDLAFLYVPGTTDESNHVGIVVGRDEKGAVLAAHCASSKGTVVVSVADAAGFQYIRTPNIYQDQEFARRAADTLLSKLAQTFARWVNSTPVRSDCAACGDYAFTTIALGADTVSAIVIGCTEQGDILLQSDAQEGTVVISAGDEYVSFRRPLPAFGAAVPWQYSER